MVIVGDSIFQLIKHWFQTYYDFGVGFENDLEKLEDFVSWVDVVLV